jgi:steroid delta-isomerase-like uncharacterized protein
MLMNAIDVAERYFAAWNDQDPKALLSVFTEDGTYCDPTTSGELTGAAIAANAQALWQSFPNLSFEIVSHAKAGPEIVVAEWLMKGTNLGEFRGLPSTGKCVSLPGADFIRVDGDKVRSVTGYFDTRAISEQLGLQVVVQPYALGPFSFGTSTSVQTGKKVARGAFSITQLVNDSEDELLETRNRTRDTAKEMMQMEGFIGLVTARIGGRGVTIAAWESADQVRQMMRSKAHGQAMERFFAGSLASSANTSVWAPERINTTWVRCAACRKMNNYEKAAGACACGEQLPEPAPYW